MFADDLSKRSASGIAERCGCSIHRVLYFIKSRGIAPESWVGNTRVFSSNDADSVVDAITKANIERSHYGRE